MSIIKVNLNSEYYIEFETCVLKTIKGISYGDELCIHWNNYTFIYKNNPKNQTYITLNLKDASYCFNNGNEYITSHDVKLFLRQTMKNLKGNA